MIWTRRDLILIASPHKNMSLNLKYTFWLAPDENIRNLTVFESIRNMWRRYTFMMSKISDPAQVQGEGGGERHSTAINFEQKWHVKGQIALRTERIEERVEWMDTLFRKKDFYNRFLF